jgi:hypothetical protein
MEVMQIDKLTGDKVAFLSFIVPSFAEAYKMPIPVAYKYLKKYGGWDFLNRNWWALHTDNDIWAIHDIYKICYQNGGMR